MKKILFVLPLLLFCSCSRVSKETVKNLTTQHVVYAEYVKRMDAGKTTREQDQQMVRNAALTYQALDREIRNWKPDKTLSEVEVERPIRENRKPEILE